MTLARLLLKYTFILQDRNTMIEMLALFHRRLMQHPFCKIGSTKIQIRDLFCIAETRTSKTRKVAERDITILIFRKVMSQQQLRILNNLEANRMLAGCFHRLDHIF